MCLFLLANKIHSDYKVIIAANRDEFYNRPAEKADFWNEAPDLLAGKDLKAGGTWLGITRTGRIAGITNYRDPKQNKENTPTRGNLTTDFLTSSYSTDEYYEKIKKKAGEYNGFNLVFGIKTNLYFFSNQTNELQKLDKGLYGLSNCLLDTPWHKVLKVKERFKEIIFEKDITARIFDILFDQSSAEDNLLPDTGVSLELEKILSAVFIKSSSYGTRNSTIITIDNDDNVLFIERTYLPDSDQYFDSEFNFKIEVE